eukprot:5028357-Amphidinium_carterae.1
MASVGCQGKVPDVQQLYMNRLQESSLFVRSYHNTRRLNVSAVETPLAMCWAWMRWAARRRKLV